MWGRIGDQLSHGTSYAGILGGGSDGLFSTKYTDGDMPFNWKAVGAAEGFNKLEFITFDASKAWTGEKKDLYLLIIIIFS